MEITQKEDILTYLKDAIELETAVEEHNLLLKNAQSLSQNRKPSEAQRVVYERPSLPSGNTDYDLEKALGFGGATFLLLGIIMLSGGMSGFGVILLVIIGIALLGIMALFLWSSKGTAENAMRNYYHSLDNYKRAQDEADRKYEKERAEQARLTKLWQTETNLIREQITQGKGAVSETLYKLYGMNVIYPKYRTLPALTSIYEYLVTGRCTELTGPHGAYNMYEDEVRKDTVISQLNTVIENLEQIRQNQYMLYQQVTAIQKNAATIAKELGQIKGYAAASTQLLPLNTYYAAMNERNTRITMYYHL